MGYVQVRFCASNLARAATTSIDGGWFRVNAVCREEPIFSAIKKCLTPLS